MLQGTVCAVCIVLTLIRGASAAGQEFVRLQGVQDLASDNIPPYEFQALSDLYYATDGADWLWGQQPGVPWNFTADANPCLDLWEGITCTSTSSNGYVHVNSVGLDDYLLTGFLPDSIGNLTALVNLTLSNNLLSSGTIPDTLATLTQLQRLDLSDCLFLGTIPASIGAMQNLQYLDLDENFFEGNGTEVPPWLCSLMEIRYISLENTNLHGTIPPCLGSLLKLEVVELAFNYLSGPLPVSLGALTGMRYIEFALNRLTGTIPHEYSAFTQLEELSVGNNYLYGTLPAYLTSMVQMRALEVYGNAFTGSLPNGLGALTRLRDLFLHSNQLTGTLPSTFSQLTLLEQFSTDDNHLSGTLPENIGGFSVLTYLNLGNNQFSGTLPASIGECRDLLKILVLRNKLTGSIPDVFEPLAKLVVFDANDNAFTGVLPSSLVTNNQMALLEVSNNRLTGTLPNVTQMDQISLFYFGAAYNHLTGPLPVIRNAFNKLSYFNVSFNCMTGSVPAQVGLYTNLQYYYLYGNLFSGSLPDAWSSLQRLSFLFLDNNILTGPIPASLGEALFLQSVNLSINHLSGLLPPTLSQLNYLDVLLLNDNALSGTLDGLFAASTQHRLATVQLSNNQFSGRIPETLYELPNLHTFAAVSNCFTGSIPVSLCESETLVTLALDGLQAATSCQQRLFPAALEGTVAANSLYTIRSPLTGGIPACLFRMRNLTTLHLSGNGLTGALPSNLTVSASLVDLSLSHNKLTGIIPAALLGRDWSNLDLSYNRLAGSATTGSLQSYPNSTALYLDNNRLSGEIPGVFAVMSTIDILQSNLFSCKADRGDLPTHDPSKDKYDCASVVFDYVLYFWMAVVSGVALVAGLLYAYRHRLQGESEQMLVRKIPLWWNALTSADLPHYQVVERATRNLIRIASLAAVYAVLILLPIYAVCTARYGTYTHQYAYAISAAYLSGPVPFAWEFVFLLMLLIISATFTLWIVRSGAAESRVSTTASVEGSSHPSTWRAYALYGAVMTVNFLIVVGVNTAYVTIALNESSAALTLAQISLALFKVAFSSLCSPLLLRWSCQRVLGMQPDAKDFISVQLLVSIVNNILVPCLVVSIISPDCFYNVFKTAARVNASFHYDGKCLVFDPYNVLQYTCVKEESDVAYTSYSPPFDYSYQCSSSFITYYAPAYVIMCIIAGFALPVAQVVLQRLHSRAAVGTRWFAVLDTVLPRILKPLPCVLSPQDGVVSVARNLYAPIFDASQHLITLKTYLALLLTFGAVFPPLALCFTVCIVAMVLLTKLKVGRFLVNAKAANQPGQVAIVEQECAGVGEPGILVRAVCMIAVSAGVFYTLFLFDTLGDKRGLSGAYWVLIVTPIASSVVAVVMLPLHAYHVVGKDASVVIAPTSTEFELSEVSGGTISPLADVNLHK